MEAGEGGGFGWGGVTGWGENAENCNWKTINMFKNIKNKINTSLKKLLKMYD